MVTIGIDAHKATHTAVAVDGVEAARSGDGACSGRGTCPVSRLGQPVARPRVCSEGLPASDPAVGVGVAGRRRASELSGIEQPGSGSEPSPVCGWLRWEESCSASSTSHRHHRQRCHAGQTDRWRSTTSGHEPYRFLRRSGQPMLARNRAETAARWTIDSTSRNSSAV